MAITQPGTIASPVSTSAFPTPSVINASVPNTPTAADVYSTENIAQTVTAPVSAPVGAGQELYNQFLNTTDIQAARTNVSELQKQINARNQAFRDQKTGLEYQNVGAMGTTGASANLIGRQVGRAGDLASNELAALGENLNAQTAYLSSLQSEAMNRYNIAQKERSQLQDLITATRGEAGISYTDSYEDALKKAAKYEDKMEKEAAKKADKDELKKTMKSLGLSYKGLSRNEMEKKLNKYMKSAKASEDELAQIELALKKKELNKPYYKPYYKPEGEKETKIDKTPSGQAKLIEEFLGYGANWHDIKQAFQEEGIQVDAGSYMDDYLKWRFEGGSIPNQSEY